MRTSLSGKCRDGMSLSLEDFLGNVSPQLSGCLFVVNIWVIKLCF